MSHELRDVRINLIAIGIAFCRDRARFARLLELARSATIIAGLHANSLDQRAVANRAHGPGQQRDQRGERWRGATRAPRPGLERDQQKNSHKAVLFLVELFSQRLPSSTLSHSLLISLLPPDAPPPPSPLHPFNNINGSRFPSHTAPYRGGAKSQIPNTPSLPLFSLSWWPLLPRPKAFNYPHPC